MARCMVEVVCVGKCAVAISVCGHVSRRYRRYRRHLNWTPKQSAANAALPNRVVQVVYLAAKRHPKQAHPGGALLDRTVQVVHLS